MNNFYIHHNGEQLGPLTVEEISALKITRTTKVWHEGLPDWVEAHTVDSLAKVFSTPPPLQPEPAKTPPPIHKPEPTPEPVYYAPAEPDRSTIAGMPKVLFIVLFSLVSVVVVFFTYSKLSRHSAAEVQSTVTNTQQDQQLQEQQAQLDAQQAELEAQRQREEAERRERERKEKMETMRTQLFAASDNLIAAQKNLSRVSKFQFMRSKADRDVQIQQATDEVIKWTNEFNRLKSELEAMGEEFATIE